MKTLAIAVSTGACYTHPCSSFNPPLSLPSTTQKSITQAVKKKIEPRRVHTGAVAADPSSSFAESFHQTLGEQPLSESYFQDKKRSGKRRVFFLDVNPLCYEGNTPSLHFFGRWVSLFLSEVSRSDPVIAVM